MKAQILGAQQISPTCSQVAGRCATSLICGIFTFTPGYDKSCSGNASPASVVINTTDSSLLFKPLGSNQLIGRYSAAPQSIPADATSTSVSLTMTSSMWGFNDVNMPQLLWVELFAKISGEANASSTQFQWLPQNVKVNLADAESLPSCTISATPNPVIEGNVVTIAANATGSYYSSIQINDPNLQILYPNNPPPITTFAYGDLAQVSYTLPLPGGAVTVNTTNTVTATITNTRQDMSWNCSTTYLVGAPVNGYCGDGFVQPPEQCDPPTVPNAMAGDPTHMCDANCQIVPLSCPTTPAVPFTASLTFILGDGAPGDAPYPVSPPGQPYVSTANNPNNLLSYTCVGGTPTKFTWTFDASQGDPLVGKVGKDRYYTLNCGSTGLKNPILYCTLNPTPTPESTDDPIVHISNLACRYTVDSSQIFHARCTYGVWHPNHGSGMGSLKIDSSQLIPCCP